MDKKTSIRDYIVKNSKFLFPVIVIVVVAITVSIALNAGKSKAEGEDGEPASNIATEPEVQALNQDPEPEEATPAPTETPLTMNENDAINTLVTAYYDSMAAGDSAAMASLYDELTENEQLRCEEMAQYLDHISSLEIYTKPGLTADTTLLYVYYRICFTNHAEEVPGWQMFYVYDNGAGGLSIKNEKNFTQEEKDYVVAVSAQVDTVEFNNRVNAEYNELMEGNPQLLAYLGELGSQVDAAIGVRLAELNAAQQEAEAGEGAEGEGAGGEAGGEAPAEGEGTAPTASGPQYAVATTTVNVRSSDSEQADKVGKVAGGTRVQVQEIGVNGWTKIVYEGSDGFIKSEFLQMEESAEGQETIGTVTANTNINVRSAASEEAEVLGILPGGESVELIANENGWCKVKYNGKVAYVKSDYVSQ